MITAESTAALRSARSGGGCFVSRTKLCQAATDYSGAVAELERAAELRPDFQEIRSVLAHLQLGEDLESGGDTVTAIAHYKSAVALAPSAETEPCGRELARVGQLDSAIDSFRAALRLDSGFAKPDQSLRQALALKAAR